MFEMKRITTYHAKYYAYDLTRRSTDGLNRLSTALFDASVDLNPHQIEAALFALESPLASGAVLADEVGLGKTIEAGIVLCQYWAERRRKLLVICPASLRKQWALELEEKFNLPAVILDAKATRQAWAQGRDPLRTRAVVIMSMSYAARLADQIGLIDWDLVVIDEAHKLRNAYRASNVTGQAIRRATDGRRTLLLTATPLQNSLLELYGLSTLIDERIFGSLEAFRSLYIGAGGDLEALRRRLAHFCKRTLRNQVAEYIRYTERRPLTVPFRPNDDEQALYEAVTAFLARRDTYALPERRRHLTALIIRKLLASSPLAIAGTLDTLRQRLEAIRDEKTVVTGAQLAEMLIEGEDIEEDLLDELVFEDDDTDSQGVQVESAIDYTRLDQEIQELKRLAEWARRIGEDTKAHALIKALDLGFQQMEQLGAVRKALIFTESRRTQDYLKAFLENHGYAGRVVTFNGSNSGPEATRIYESWLARNSDTGRCTGSRSVDVRTALIEHFRDHADVMIATEAGAEGVNLQFCSLVINYDLPWNPQRIEQRIGRCHRYGQKHDVVVVNFVNERNEVDRRVLELLSDKFRLFSGVFGASDDVLGVIESGVDFEQRIMEIYETCRTAEEIDAAFAALQQELDEKIQARIDETRKLLLEHFDEDVHERLRLRLADARAHLDRIGRRFWELSRFVLEPSYATFFDSLLAFDLHTRPYADARLGRYRLISKNEPADGVEGVSTRDAFLYRLSHPLGEWVIEQAKQLHTPSACLEFDITNHPTKVSVIEALKGKHGFLSLQRLVIESYEREEHLLFTMLTDDGLTLDQETAEKLFGIEARVVPGHVVIPEHIASRLAAEARRHAEATISRSLEANSRHFNEARERLEQWADDMLLAAEKALKDTKEKIKALRREARHAETLAEQHEIQQRIAQLERQQRKQRREIFEVEDQIMQKRDALIAELESRLTQKTVSEELFTIEWAVV